MIEVQNSWFLRVLRHSWKPLTFTLISFGSLLSYANNMDLNLELPVPIPDPTPAPIIDHEESLRLSSYRTRGEPIVLGDIEKDASGLTFNTSRKTLVAVVNNPAQIIELSLEGEVLRRIPLEGFNDPEGITYLGNEHYAVIEERNAAVVFFRIYDNTTEVSRSELRSVALPMALDGNNGLEGIAADLERGSLYIVKEKDPRQIFRVDGFLSDGQPLQVIEPWDMPEIGSLKKDLSGLHFDQVSGNLILLSDESKIVVEVSPEGVHKGYLPLRKGFAGLSENIPQAEGVTMDHLGNLYVLSEPNRLYRFTPEDSRPPEVPPITKCFGCGLKQDVSLNY